MPRVVAAVVLLLPAPDGITKAVLKSSRGREEEEDETWCRVWEGGSVKGRKHPLLLNKACSLRTQVHT